MPHDASGIRFTVARAGSPLLGEWDAFVKESARGQYHQLSGWLAGYEPYGIRWIVLVAQEAKSARIVGGTALLEFGPPLLRFSTIPMGPILDADHDWLLEHLLDRVVEHARARKSLAVQIVAPCETGRRHPALLPSFTVSGTLHMRRAIPLSLITIPGQLLLVSLPPDGDVEERSRLLLESFDAHTRRNIRTALASGLVCTRAESEQDIRTAFSLIERNGRLQGYQTRTWAEFGPALCELVRRADAVVHLAWMDGAAVGAHVGIFAGKKLSYLMGGVERLPDDPKTGHFLHWHAMHHAAARGCLWYDFASGGSPGVMRFKLGFHPDIISCDTRVHIPLRPMLLAILLPCMKAIRKHRKRIARVIGASRRLLRGGAGADASRRTDSQ